MKFSYQARDQQGHLQTGTVEASTEEAAVQVLAEYGLFVTKLETGADKPIYEKEFSFFDKPSPKDVMMFSRQLSIMIKSQVPLVEALRTLSRQIENTAFRREVMKIQEDIEAGTALSEAFAKYPKTFSSFYISMAESGEASGKLSEVLDYLAEHLEREYELNSQIKGAMVYPAFVLSLVVVVLFLMIFFMVPTIAGFLIETSDDLPVFTTFVIGASDFLRAWWWLLFAIIIAIVILIFQVKDTKEGKEFIGTAVLKIPVLSNVFKLTYISRFAGNLATLITGGIPISSALDITSRVVGNHKYEKIVKEAQEAVRRGETISSVLVKYPSEFPPVFAQMVAVGEQSGSLDTTLNSVVGFYRREVDRSVNSLISLMEPILIVILGLVVGLVMAAVFIPLYQSFTAI